MALELLEHEKETMFICEDLSAKMSKTTCIARQEKLNDKGGLAFPYCAVCKCGKEILLKEVKKCEENEESSKIKTLPIKEESKKLKFCINCLRTEEEIKILSSGYCNYCYSIKMNKATSELEKARILKEFKTKVENGTNKGRLYPNFKSSYKSKFNKLKNSKKNIVIKDETDDLEEDSKITIIFNKEDLSLLKTLEETAKKNRRSIDQQILYILDIYLNNEEENIV